MGSQAAASAVPWQASLGPVAPVVAARWMLAGYFAVLASGIVIALWLTEPYPEITRPSAGVGAVLFDGIMHWLLRDRLIAIVTARLPLSHEVAVGSVWWASRWRPRAELIGMGPVYWGLTLWLGEASEWPELPSVP